MQTDGPTELWGLGAALPAHRATQDETAVFFSRVARSQPDCPPRFHRYVEAVARRSGIRHRHSVLRDYALRDPEGFTFFPKNWALEPFPTTAARMAQYEVHSVDLAERAARMAVADAAIAPSDISHLVMTTCTGFFAPGPDVALTERLGLRRDVKRAQVGFMGCYAGVNGIRLADQIVRGEASACVLLVAVELCSLHFQRTPDLETLVPNLLFADGASAAVFGRGGASRAHVVATRSELYPDSSSMMGWKVGDHGFVMNLSDRVPRRLGEAVRPFVRALRPNGGIANGDIAGWAVHPGGKRILDAVGDALQLDDDALDASFGVLRDSGNLSSATILCVLERQLAKKRSGLHVALAFGPGLTMEGVALEVP